MTWQDCTGQSLEMQPPQTVDACGICGGDNMTCTDCAGVLNGSKIMSMNTIDCICVFVDTKNHCN